MSDDKVESKRDGKRRGGGSVDGEATSGGGLGNAARWAARLAVAGLIALLVASLPLELFSEKGFKHYLRLQKELSALRERNERLERGVSRLQREISELRHDDQELERVARDELGLIREGEVVFVVEERKWP